MSETAVERRLQNEEFRCRHNGQSITADALDAGREAIELLRLMPVDAVRGPVGSDWLKFRAALLARCEGEK